MKEGHKDGIGMNPFVVAFDGANIWAGNQESNTFCPNCER
jgi:hypothetical protein